MATISSSSASLICERTPNCYVAWVSQSLCNRVLVSVLTLTSAFANGANEMKSNQVNIRVGSKSLKANLVDNDSANRFKEMLPLKVEMTDLNQNEKYFDLSKALPTNSTAPGVIKSGDIMLYGSKTLVLFYKTFSSPYSYTKLGHVDGASDLASVLGTGSVPVVFENE
jgi:hypothetical protein